MAPQRGFIKEAVSRFVLQLPRGRALVVTAYVCPLSSSRTPRATWGAKDFGPLVLSSRRIVLASGWRDCYARFAAWRPVIWQILGSILCFRWAICAAYLRHVPEANPSRQATSKPVHNSCKATDSIWDHGNLHNITSHRIPIFTRPNGLDRGPYMDVGRRAGLE